MELHKISNGEKAIFILLDKQMRLVKPVNQFLDYLKVRGKAENTLLAYGNDLKLFFLYLEEKELTYDEVGISTIQDFIKSLYFRHDAKSNVLWKNRRSESTVNRVLGTVYGFYCYHSAVNGLIIPFTTEKNGVPTTFKDIFYHTRKSGLSHRSVFTLKESGYHVHIYTDKEIKEMYSVLPTDRDKLLFMFLVKTGARISEALALKIDDIPIPDFSNPISILHSIKSKGKRRDIYIPTEFVAELDRFIIENRLQIETNHNFLFITHHPFQNNRPISYRGVYEIFKRAGSKIGLDFKFHDIRHTFITRLVESGMDFSVVRILAGHEHISTTEKYVTLSTKFITDSLAEYWDKTSVKGGNDNE